ncbi:hypothetical protein CSKR_104204 [Clonorchis sinensis]|uniref:Uncharacterized protein n=1 Tax=Clonorchis sinensis TaxID=79923 RepID=A0A419Q212_CLOSI|nr:hypothetical protein CSKR_104204 [Clonorchis sinensis]
MNRTVCKETQQQNSNTFDTKSTSLAEVLAKFPLRRPLYTNEASALCYQILGQLREHLSEKPPKVGVDHLQYPTLANILVTEDGFAYVRPLTNKKPGFQSSQDWLAAFSQTLRSHTQSTDSKDSETFQALVDNLCSENFTYNQLKERIVVWQRTCLYLSSLGIQNRRDIDKMLQGLHQRSSQAQSYRILSGEVKKLEEKQITRGSLTRKSDGSPVMDSKPASCVGKVGGLDEREAFKCWTEKWQHVNAEYLARQVTRQGPAANTGYTGKLRVTTKSLSIPEFPTSVDTRSSKQNTQAPLPENSVEASNFRRCTEQNIVDDNSFSHMDTLKAMYSNFISRPLILLRQSLRDSRNQPHSMRAPHECETLSQLQHLLRSSSDHRPSKVVKRPLNECHV